MIQRFVKTTLIFIGLCLTMLQSYSQTKRIDALRSQLAVEKEKSQQQVLLLAICEQYYSLSADSLLRYVNLGLSISASNSAAYFRFKNFYCYCLFKTGNPSEACIYVDSLLRNLSIVKNNKYALLDILSCKSSALIRNNQNKEAIEAALTLLEEAEKLKDTIGVLKAYTILGWADMELENYTEAVKWLRKGLEYSDNPSLIINSSSLHNNIASCFNNLGERDSAFFYINKGLENSRAAESFTGQANALNIRAAMYLKENRISEAEKDLEEALVVREKNGDIHYVISDMAQLASFYASVNETGKGIAIAQKGIELAKKTNNLSKLIFLNVTLAENYKVAHKNGDYANTLSLIIQLKDSLYEKNSEGAIAEMITKYELQKKENIIIQQENNLIKNRYFSIGSSIAFIFAFIIVWLVYRTYSRTQKQRMELALAEQKTISSKAVQLAEEKERKRIAADLHDNLGSYAAAITSNIRYLKHDEDSENAGIIIQLDENAKGIVTQLSDTIWVLKNEQLHITNLADRFKAWAQRLIQNYPDIRYDYEEDISNDVEFTPGKMLNIFLILKECLNNSLKHSHCTEIKISVISNDTLSICIADNGTGFDGSLTNSGNGIDNIKHRAKECDLEVKWEAVIPTGTRLTLFSTTTN